MRILLVTHVFLPESSGGTEILVHGLARSLTGCGHEVLVLTGSFGSARDPEHQDFSEFTFDDIRVVRFQPAARADKSGMHELPLDYVNSGFEAGFRRLLTVFRPDVVHFHHLARLSIRAIDLCKEFGIPSFLTVTDFWYICVLHSLLLPDGRICDGPKFNGANCLKHVAAVTPAQFTTRLLGLVPGPFIGGAMHFLGKFRHRFSGRIGFAQNLQRRESTFKQKLTGLKKVFVPTLSTRLLLEKKGFCNLNFRILPFGIDDHGYQTRTRRHPGPTLTIGFVGTLAPHKGCQVLIDAVTHLPAELSVRIRIFGNVPEDQARFAKDLCESARHDSRIEFSGTFENRRFPEVLDRLDAVVIPSLWHENMPLVVLSAQAAGCPVIASDVGGLSDVIKHEMNGLLVAPGSAPELSAAISRLATEPELLERLSRAAIRPADMGTYSTQLIEEYSRVVSN